MKLVQRVLLAIEFRSLFKGCLGKFRQNCPTQLYLTYRYHQDYSKVLGLISVGLFSRCHFFPYLVSSLRYLRTIGYGNGVLSACDSQSLGTRCELIFIHNNFLIPVQSVARIIKALYCCYVITRPCFVAVKLIYFQRHRKLLPFFFHNCIF